MFICYVKSVNVSLSLAINENVNIYNIHESLILARCQGATHTFPQQPKQGSAQC